MFKIDLFILSYDYECSACMYVSALYRCLYPWSQKKALEPWELELWAAVSHHIDAKSWTQMLSENKCSELPSYFSSPYFAVRPTYIPVVRKYFFQVEKFIKLDLNLLLSGCSTT